MRQVPGTHTTPRDVRVATHFPPSFHPFELPVRSRSRRRAAASCSAIGTLRANQEPFQAAYDAFGRAHADRA